MYIADSQKSVERFSPGSWIPGGLLSVRAALAAVLFFCNVNQVLVRFWTRVTGDLSLDGSRVPSFDRLV